MRLFYLLPKSVVVFFRTVSQKNKKKSGLFLVVGGHRQGSAKADVRETHLAVVVPHGEVTINGQAIEEAAPLPINAEVRIPEDLVQRVAEID